MTTRTMKQIVAAAERMDELHRLIDAGLIVLGERNLEFPRPDHPEVVAWCSLPKPDDDTRRRALLLWEVRQMLRKRHWNADARTITSLVGFTTRIADMPMEEIDAQMQAIADTSSPSPTIH